MPTIWFALVAIMLAAYALFDGFDLGAGALHLIAARTDSERRALLAAIGPVWDGNEVWLLAGGGTLFFAFPLLYASSFSGFYLPLNIVLWLLLGRAIGIEFRAHVDSPIWRAFFDGVFALSSLVLVIFFGAALGNVIRGVPLGADHYFFAPLWTNWRPGAEPGILDWYTVTCAVVTLAATCLHGALYVAMKTAGDLNRRMRAAVRILLPAVAILSAIAIPVSVAVRPQLLDNYRATPAGWIFPILVAASLVGIFHFDRKGKERYAFYCSCLYVVATLSGAAFALYPTLLPSSGDPANAITIHNAAAGTLSLSTGLIWWTGGMLVAIGYFILIYSMFRGKVGHAQSHG